MRPSHTGWLYEPGDLKAMHDHVRDLIGDGVIFRLRQVRSGQHAPVQIARQQVARRDGATIPLTVTQARVMECLMRHAPAIVDHGRLMRAIWGPEGGDMQALHSHLYALRQAIDRPFERALIHNVHGVGYRFGESA